MDAGCGQLVCIGEVVGCGFLTGATGFGLPREWLLQIGGGTPGVCGSFIMGVGCGPREYTGGDRVGGLSTMAVRSGSPQECLLEGGG